MKETTLSKLHRYMGESLILFLGLQVLTFLIVGPARLGIISYGEFIFLVRPLHLGGGIHGDIYLVILAVAVLLHGGDRYYDCVTDSSTVSQPEAFGNRLS